MCPVEDPEAFKQEYIAHMKVLTGEDLTHMKKEQYDLYLDRVADVFEYFISTFDQSRYFLTDKLLSAVHESAMENARYATKVLDARTHTWHVNERLEYVRAVSQTVVRKIKPLL
jgi:hypothetical protein